MRTRMESGDCAADHADICLFYLEQETIDLPLRGRGGSLMSSLSRMAIINLLSHRPKVAAVIYKGSRGQSSTYSLTLLIIQ